MKGRGLFIPGGAGVTFYFSGDVTDPRWPHLVDADEFAFHLRILQGSSMSGPSAEWIETPHMMPVPLRDMQGRVVTKPLPLNVWHQAVSLQGRVGITGLGARPWHALSNDARSWFSYH